MDGQQSDQQREPSRIKKGWQSDFSRAEALMMLYSQSQQVIQFFDAKAGAYVTVNGVILSFLTSNVVDVMNKLYTKTFPLKFFLIVMFSLVSAAFLYRLVRVFYQSFLVLLPRRGYRQSIQAQQPPGLLWAEDVNAYIQAHSLEAYAMMLSHIDEEQLELEISYAIANLSLIICYKLKHLENATSHFKWAILLWAVLFCLTGILEVGLSNLSG